MVRYSGILPHKSFLLTHKIPQEAFDISVSSVGQTLKVQWMSCLNINSCTSVKNFHFQKHTLHILIPPKLYLSPSFFLQLSFTPLSLPLYLSLLLLLPSPPNPSPFLYHPLSLTFFLPLFHSLPHAYSVSLSISWPAFTFAHRLNCNCLHRQIIENGSVLHCSLLVKTAPIHPPVMLVSIITFLSTCSVAF